MTNLLKFYSIEETEKWLISLPKSIQFYVDGTDVIIPQDELLNGSYSAHEALQHIDNSFKEFQTVTCYYCGFILEKDETVCSDCGKEILRCVVCKLPISFSVDIGYCLLCNAPAHLVHLQVWIKTQGTCPQCLQEIPLEGIFQEDIPNKEKKQLVEHQDIIYR
ncbi:MAG: hypothetical protein U9O98_03165 [Asgard group archaeon]|nr:hypothetical protein [Asgard group archaeon]